MVKLVSIIVPCRNEAGFIEQFCNDVFSQECVDFEIEIIIADGLSEDDTVNRIQALMCRDSRLKYINNLGRIVSTGLNSALAESKGEFIVRMDVHTKYNSDYVYQCVKILTDNPGVSCVGGAWVAKGKSNIQSAIAAAFQSSIGSGGASSRQVNYSGVVDTVYLGAWRRSELLEIGGFDENLIRNQDDELALRIKRNGGQIWQSAKIKSEYYPRESLLALYNQFSQYGYWKIPVIKKHRIPASLRHVVPFLFFVVLIGLGFFGLFFKVMWSFLALLLLIYFSILFIGTSEQRSCLSNKKSEFLAVLAVATMHIAYAIGFGRGILDFLILKSDERKSMTILTR
jgi:succinoglycan biosynthesis protein ExoA